VKPESRRPLGKTGVGPGLHSLISVALATYNGSSFLRHQLDSIYAQTWNNIEVVACDDNSSDDTVAILEEYRQRYGLRYKVNKQNLGFVRNFEKVLLNCHGEFIALADQDDIWLPKKLERLVAGIESADLVYSDALLVDKHGRELPGSLMQTSGVRPVSGRQFAYFVCNTCVTGCTTLIRRDLLEKALPIPHCEIYHDWWLAVVASQYGGVRFLPELLVKYRQHDANDTGVTVKTGLITRLAAHLRGETSEAKMRYYRLLRDRALCYPTLQVRLALGTGELGFLDDIRHYAESLINQRFRFVSFVLAFRYRNILFPASGPAEKLVFVFSKLINKFVS
jgi:glycosyltransferase involved in cell wall biosynthesis